VQGGGEGAGPGRECDAAGAGSGVRGKAHMRLKHTGRLITLADPRCRTQQAAQIQL